MLTTEESVNRQRLVQELLAERLRQQEKHGYRDGEDHGPCEWIAVIAKHAGLGAPIPPDTLGMALDRFRKQMVSVGALAVAALEWTDREIARLTGAPPTERP